MRAAWLILMIVASESWLSAQDHPEFLQPSYSQQQALDGLAPVWVYHKDVQEVSVLFTVLDKNRFVTDLTENDVTIKDDDRSPEAVVAFRTQPDLPLRIGLLIDTSQSVYVRFGFEQAAAGAFLNRLLQPGRDQAFIVGFSDRPHLVQDFSNHLGALWRGLAVLAPDGHTALFDSVVFACRRMVAHPERQFVARTLVLLSDGEDNSSRATLKDAIHAAQQSEVDIYVISTNDDLSYSGSADGDQNLKRLAQETGGRALFPGSLSKLDKALSRLNEELRSRYAISYRPREFQSDGRYRRIEIVAQKAGKKLKVHARKGYYAQGKTSELAKEHQAEDQSSR